MALHYLLDCFVLAVSFDEKVVSAAVNVLLLFLAVKIAKAAAFLDFLISCHFLCRVHLALSVDRGSYCRTDLILSLRAKILFLCCPSSIFHIF